MNKFCYMAALAALCAQWAWAQPGVVPVTDHAAARFLDQATWGPTPASITQLQSMGFAAWLNQQFLMPPSHLPDQPILNDATGKPNRDLRPVQRAFFEMALAGNDQLRQRVAFALSEIWVVSKLDVGYAYAFPPYWQILQDNAFTNYRDIIKAMTLSPAMGRYLNMANNNKANAAKNTSANENYARELMQLFTLGLDKLNIDGSPALDASHNPIPTYDQTVVVNMAKLLTGWTYPTAPGKTVRVNNPAYFEGQMFPVEKEHDETAKVLFDGWNVPAGQTADEDLNSLLDALMAQDTMAPFISKQLIQHLVTSNPSPAYVERVSNAFLDNGQGVRGDMKAVVTAILMDPEARVDDDPNVAANPSFGHLREPVLFLANILRGLNAQLTDQSAPYNDANSMGQNLFSSPSVFSYFSPQYRNSSGALAPEFQIYSTQTAANRADIVNAIVYGRLDKGTTVDLTPFINKAVDPNTLADYISSVFLYHSMSSDLRSAIEQAVGSSANPVSRAKDALYLTLTSGEYQIVH